MTDPVLTGLVKRRTELVADVRRTETIFKRLMEDIETLDAAISQFDPAYRPMRLPVRTVGTTGRITRTLLEMLRKSPEPMTLREMSVALMMTFGLDHQNKGRVTLMIEQVRQAMIRQKANGTVMSGEGPGRAAVWRIAG